MTGVDRGSFLKTGWKNVQEMRLRETPVAFRSDDAQLVGIFHYPEEDQDRIVVMCHGYTGHKVENKRLFVEAARALAGAGIAAFRFDFYGSGDSEGDFVETRISTNVQNLRDAVDFVRSCGFRRVALLGISMGAATCILGMQAGLDVECAVLWSTVPDFARLFSSKSGVDVTRATLPETYEYNGWLVHRDLITDALRYDVQAAARNAKVPLLFVQGDQDDPVFVEGFNIFRSAELPHADFVLIPGAGHTFQTVRHRAEVIRITLEWLRKIWR